MRLFVAIPIEGEAREKLEAIQRRLPKKGLKLVESENLHMTLRFIGDGDPVEWAERIGQIKEGPFELVLDKLGAFPSERRIRVVWAGCGPVESLLNIHRLIGDGELSPHVTLARVKSKPDAALGEMLRQRIEVKVAVGKVVLMNSTLTPGGPSYEVLYEKAL